MNHAIPSPAPRAPTTAWETASLMGILLLFLGLSAWTCTRYPEPWGDEVMYTDPAVRYASGKGFTSAAWPSQDATAFWAGNCPLHEFALIPWLEIFGPTARGVRSFDALLVALSALALWLAAGRSGWIDSAGGRLGLVFLVLSSSSATFMVHYGRPDAITFLLASGMVWVVSAAPAAWRKWLAALLGAAAPWAGLQLCAMAAAAAIFYLLPARRGAWPLCLWVAGGMLAGAAALGGFYAAHGVARSFIENTLASSHTLSGDLAQLAVIHDANARQRTSTRFDHYLHFYRVWLVDRSYPWALLSVWICSLQAWKAGSLEKLSPLGFALTAGMGVPVFVLLAGKYPVYYGWMGFLIVSIGAVSAISRFWGSWSAPVRGLAVAPLVAACWAGLPRAWVAAGPPANQAKLDQFLQANLSSSDQVLADPTAYYASANRAAETYYILYAGGRRLREIPKAEREALTALVVSPANLELATAKAGGRWKAGPSCEYATDDSGRPRSVTVYRREAPPK